MGVAAASAAVSSVVAVRSASGGGTSLASPAAGTDARVRGFQLPAWCKAGGQADMVALASRHAEFEKWFKESTDAGTGAFDGDALRPARDTATARRHLGVPDPESGRRWPTLPAGSRDAARACTSTLDSERDDVPRSTRMPERLFDAYEQADDTLPRLTDRVGHRAGAVAAVEGPLTGPHVVRSPPRPASPRGGRACSRLPDRCPPHPGPTRHA